MKPKTITVFAQLCNMLPREPLIRISQDQTPSEAGRRFNAQKFNTWDLLCALIFCHLGPKAPVIIEITARDKADRGLCRLAETARDAPLEERVVDRRSPPALRTVVAQPVQRAS